MADEDDLDALLDEAANDVLNDQDADDMLDDVLDDVLGGESTAKMDTSPARSATRAPPKVSDWLTWDMLPRLRC